MVIPHIFPVSTGSQSKDVKIYKSFEPYLKGILGISQEEFLNDKNLRHTYQQKFMAIKSKFQREERDKSAISDDDCHRKISRYAQGWQEFISTAISNTSDNGQFFIASVPLDRYILMSNNERKDLEDQLSNAAVARVHAILQKGNIPNSQELDAMLNDNNDKGPDEKTHKM